MSRKLRRRAVIKSIGAAGVIGLAGCTSDGGGGDGGDGGGTPTDGDGGDTPMDSGGGGTPTDSGTPEGDDGGGTGGGSMRTAKVGILMPTSGDLADLGQLIQQGGVLAAEQLKGADIPIGIDYQTEDSQTSPSAGVSAAQALVNAGYPGIMGPASSGVNIAVSKQVYIPNQVVGCSPSSTSPNVTTLQDNDFVFRTAPSDALQGKVLAQIARNRVNASSASTLFVNNDYGQALSQSFADAFKNQGGTIQSKVAFEKQQTSYSSVLSEALSNNPDTLVIIGYPQSGQTIFRDYYSSYSDDDFTLLLTDGLAEDSLPDDVGNDLSNVLGSTPQASGPARKAFDQMYQDAYGQSPGVFNAHAYDAVATLLLANAWAGENSGPAVRDSMRKVANPDGKQITAENLPEGIRMAVNNEAINYSGASSSVNFDQNGDMKAVTYGVWEFGDSGVTTIDSVNFGGSN